MTVKTLVIFSSFLELPVFYVLDGDKRHWDGVVVNCDKDEDYKGTDEQYAAASEEICKELYTDKGQLPAMTDLAVAFAAVMGGKIEVPKDGTSVSGFYTANCAFAP